MNRPDYMTAEDIITITLENEHLRALSELILHGRPSTKAEVHVDMQPYWLFKDGIAFLAGTAIKGRRIIVPILLWHKVLRQLHRNHMGIEKTRMLAYESFYWLNMNMHNETVKKCPTCLDYQVTQPKDIIISHDIPGQPWEFKGANIFTIKTLPLHYRLLQQVPCSKAHQQLQCRLFNILMHGHIFRIFPARQDHIWYWNKFQENLKLLQGPWHKTFYREAGECIKLQR